MVESTNTENQVPFWATNLKKAIVKNQQLAFTQFFQIAAAGEDGQGIICETMKCENLVCQEQKHENGSHIVSYVDKRSDIGKVLSSGNAAVELCWNLNLTKDRFRLKCTYELITTKSEEDTGESEALKIWQNLRDDQQMVYKSPQPGHPIIRQEDYLQQYEPQALDAEKVQDNFILVKFLPFTVDHLIEALPEVVSDSRRKPQQYSSIAQPFKKDRRFKHSLNTETQEWSTIEVNP